MYLLNSCELLLPWYWLWRGGFSLYRLFWTKFQKLEIKKLKTAKTQGKFCPKTQGNGAFPNLQLKETQKNVVKNRKLALIWHFHFKFFILNLKTTLKIENLDIFREKTQHFCKNSRIFSQNSRILAQKLNAPELLSPVKFQTDVKKKPVSDMSSWKYGTEFFSFAQRACKF